MKVFAVLDVWLNYSGNFNYFGDFSIHAASLAYSGWLSTIFPIATTRFLH
jgi:hypothetical protein